MNASSMSRLVVAALLLSVSPVVGAAGETPSAPGVQISAPGGGERVATGWSGAVVVEVSGATAQHEGHLSLSCPSSGYAHRTTFSVTEGRVEVPVAPVEAPAGDCSATAEVRGPLEAGPSDEPGGSARVDFSAWHRVGFTDARISPVFYPTVRDGYADAAELVFGLTAAAEVDLLVFDPVTQRVVREESARFEAGSHTWSWNGATSAWRRAPSLPTGRYLLAAVTEDPVARQSVGVIGWTEIARRTITRRSVRTVPALQAERVLRGACSSGAGEVVVALVCRGTRTSYAELSGVVQVPRGARLRRVGSHHDKPAADERPGRVLHDLERLSAKRARVTLRIDGRRALVVEDLYVVWAQRIQQRPVSTVPGPEGIVAGEVTGGPGQWHIELAEPARP